MTRVCCRVCCRVCSPLGPVLQARHSSPHRGGSSACLSVLDVDAVRTQNSTSSVIHFSSTVMVPSSIFFCHSACLFLSSLWCLFEIRDVGETDASLCGCEARPLAHLLHRFISSVTRCATFKDVEVLVSVMVVLRKVDAFMLIPPPHTHTNKKVNSVLRHYLK